MAEITGGSVNGNSRTPRYFQPTKPMITISAENTPANTGLFILIDGKLIVLSFKFILR